MFFRLIARSFGEGLLRADLTLFGTAETVSPNDGLLTGSTSAAAMSRRRFLFRSKSLCLLVLISADCTLGFSAKDCLMHVPDSYNIRRWGRNVGSITSQ